MVCDFMSAGKLFHSLGPKYETAFWPRILLPYGDCSLYADLRVLCPWLHGWYTSDTHVGDMFLKMFYAQALLKSCFGW